MSNEIKVFRIYGYMLIGHDSVPEWRKFVKEIRALKLEHALEKLYSEFGSRHKVKRSHIKILKVEEVPLDQVLDRTIKEIASLTKMVVE